MELSEAKNPYDIFFKVFELDEASIPENASTKGIGRRPLRTTAFEPLAYRVFVVVPYLPQLDEQTVLPTSESRKFCRLV